MPRSGAAAGGGGSLSSRVMPPSLSRPATLASSSCATRCAARSPACRPTNASPSCCATRTTSRCRPSPRPRIPAGTAKSRLPPWTAQAARGARKRGRTMADQRFDQLSDERFDEVLRTFLASRRPAAMPPTLRQATLRQQALRRSRSSPGAIVARVLGAAATATLAATLLLAVYLGWALPPVAKPDGVAGSPANGSTRARRASASCHLRHSTPCSSCRRSWRQPPW